MHVKVTEAAVDIFSHSQLLQQLLSRVSRLTASCARGRGGVGWGEMRDPGNEVVTSTIKKSMSVNTQTESNKNDKKNTYIYAHNEDC